MSTDPLAALAGRTFAAVLFDMDGTLIDSTPSVARSWAAWAAHYQLDVTAMRGMHGIPARGVVARLLAPELHDEGERHITDLELADVEGIEVLPGAEAALTALAPSGRAAIATSCTIPLAQARLGATRLPRPDVVVTASDVTHGKPAPDPFLLPAERLGVDPRDCLVVEDAPAGLAAGTAAGCATLAVTTTTPREDLLADPNADAVIDTLADVRFIAETAGVRLEYARD